MLTRADKRVWIVIEIEGSETRRRGVLFESVVLSAAAIAFGCVAFADFLNHAVNPKVPAPSAAKSATGPHTGVDYSTTGSIISLRQPPALNPCEKKD
jgi:hypothetical protein